jgi:CheY-like chemotaxis protein
VVARYRPACIILDVLLPGMGGDTAARALRALGDETPIILHTAQWPAAEAESLEDWGRVLGVQAVLVKGASARPLEAMLTEVERLVPREEAE